MATVKERTSAHMGESEAKKKWQKENTVFVGVKLQKSTDKDIVEYLEGKNRNDTVKKALRLLMAQEKAE